MKLLIVFVAVFAMASATTYSTVYTYTGSDCQDANIITQTTTISSSACKVVACTAFVRKGCSSEIPAGFGVISDTFNPRQNCTGTVVTRTSRGLGNCTRNLLSIVTPEWTQKSCDVNKSLVTDTYSDNKCTVKTGSKTTPLNTCGVGGLIKQSCVGGVGGGSVCFHKDTLITYKTQQLKLKDLVERKHKECHIPHIVRSRGVVISTSCSKTPLRLTDSHLVVTRKHGHKVMIAASEMRKGDIVFSNMQETQHCKVTQVHREEHVQEYFGLNCVESEVLANGVKTSTFGVYHRIPALWMKHMSKVLGIHTASKWGDHMATVAAKLRLL